MTNLRLTIAMFILAAALAPAFLVSWHHGQEAKVVQRVSAPIAPVVPPGFKTAPWEGVRSKRTDNPEEKMPADKAAQPATPSESKPATSAASPVVVELFTSEGCSSCPPAEKLLNELAAAQAADSKVFFIAYHVDYWDKLGWKDRFASSKFSERQREYATAFDTATVYTPQTIVNGEAGFVGSDRSKAESAIAEARKVPAKFDIEATCSEIKPGLAQKIEYTLRAIGEGKFPADVRVCAVLVENGLSTPVKRGENQGRTLKHDRIVRSFEQAALAGDDSASPRVIELAVPSDIVAEKAGILVFVQEPKSMKILAAALAKQVSAAR